MKVKPQATVFFSILFVLAGILGSWALGWWQTESNKVPPRLEGVGISGEADAAAGEALAYDPEGIKGSFTFGEISTLYGIPLEDLADAFMVDRVTAEEFKVKELETVFGKDSEVGTSSVRLFVAWYKGLPFERKEESFLPAPAVAILRQKAALSGEQAEYLEAHIYNAEQ